MKIDIAILPGDGIGPEVVAQARKVLRVVAETFDHELVEREYPVGLAALEAHGVPLPEETLAGCLAARAVLLGAVGGAQRLDTAPGMRPEDGLLQLRKSLGAFANLRPAVVHDALIDASPLKAEAVRGCDILIVRELLGGLYFGTPRGFEENTPSGRRAFNTMTYSEMEVERIAHVAFRAAQGRRRKVTSVDKSNVLEASQLWRETVNRVARDYPDIELEHVLVDACAMRLVTNPRRFDVVLTENLFGDILSDEAAVIAGSIGMLASASIGGPVGLYEPVHGSAPDIAGQGKANPVGTIASAAMMLRHSFGLDREARTVETAIEKVLNRGLRTADLVRGGEYASTDEAGEAICRAVSAIDR